MKFVLNKLQPGDRVWGIVEEVLPVVHGEAQVLMNFHGDLCRVSNDTRRILKVGDRVEVIVRAVAPLRFQLATDSHIGFRRLDLSV
jgi:hypothetical protein